MKGGCVGTIFIAVALAFVVLLLGGLHNHFAEHAAQITHNERAKLAQTNHQRRLAWQKAHPAEYARQRAKARAEAQRREEKLALQRERQRKAQEAQVAAQERQREEESHFYHGTPDCLVLDNRTLTTESDEAAWYILGKVTNRCDHDLSYVQVEIDFYDSAGNQETSGLDNVNNLATGQTWAFKKPVYETQSSGGSWRVVGLKGF